MGGNINACLLATVTTRNLFGRDKYVGGLSAKASLCNFYVKKSYSQFSRNKADFCSALPAAAAWCHRDTTSAVGGILK